MYKVIVFKDGVWWGKDYNFKGDGGQYWLLSTADKNTRIIKDATIIFKPDWEKEQKLRNYENTTRKQRLCAAQWAGVCIYNTRYNS